MAAFICNICGKKNEWTGEKLERERPSCGSCGSTVRARGLLHALSLEIFGTSLPLPDFPRVKSVRGLGISDSVSYAGALAASFDYRNTFYDRAPRFDITQPPEHEAGLYDFVTASEVFEHTTPPAGKSFRGAARLLNPNGVLVMSVPYEVLQADEAEHFSKLGDFGLVRVGDSMVLVNRRADGQIEVFENLVFHCGFGDPALEMRMFSEAGLKALLAEAGFTEVRFHGDDYLPFGIAHAETWSLPIAARRGAFHVRQETLGEIMAQWGAMRNNQARWPRVWRRLGLLRG